MVGGSYRSCPNFTAGNDVEPGMFCGQAAARGATYRLRRVGEITDIFQICRAPTVTFNNGFQQYSSGLYIKNMFSCYIIKNRNGYWVL